MVEPVANMSAALVGVVHNFSVAEAWEVMRPLSLFVAGMVVYAVFVFKFYRFVARKDIFRLQFFQDRTAEGTAVGSFLGLLWYFLEYLLFFPILVFFWFFVITLLLAFLARNQSIQSVLLLAMALVSAVRITAYYSEDLSRDLAKMLPFALLGVFLVDISYFSLASSMELIKQIPAYWKILVYYLFFVMGLEFILRVLGLLFGKGQPSDPE
ncbi:MAG: hypothetical protein ABIH41_03665 [Nanoarchaeota archaeon]